MKKEKFETTFLVFSFKLKVTSPLVVIFAPSLVDAQEIGFLLFFVQFQWLTRQLQTQTIQT